MLLSLLNQTLIKKLKKQMIGQNGKRPLINEELNSIKENRVWSLVDINECMQKKPLTTRWVFKKKTDRDKNIIFRARLVVKGFEEK